MTFFVRGGHPQGGRENASGCPESRR